MTTLARIAFATVAAVAVFGAIVSILLAGTVHSLQHSGTPARQQQQITRLQGQVAGLTARLDGEHKDVITCGDLQQMGLQDTYGVNLSENASFQISAALASTPVPLPQHCING